MKQVIKSGISTFLAGALCAMSAASAAGFYEEPPPRDVDMCVAEIRARADYGDATRVRHDIVSTTRRPVGFAIEIETTVYAPTTGSVLREYETVCIATGGRSPSRFQISEKQ
jgi:hypothetical protein